MCPDRLNGHAMSDVRVGCGYATSLSGCRHAEMPFPARRARYVPRQGTEVDTGV